MLFARSLVFDPQAALGVGSSAGGGGSKKPRPSRLWLRGLSRCASWRDSRATHPAEGCRVRRGRPSRLDAAENCGTLEERRRLAVAGAPMKSVRPLLVVAAVGLAL